MRQRMSVGLCSPDKDRSHLHHRSRFVQHGDWSAWCFVHLGLRSRALRGHQHDVCQSMGGIRYTDCAAHTAGVAPLRTMQVALGQEVAQDDYQVVAYRALDTLLVPTDSIDPKVPINRS